jgi:hypothetical protein
MTLALTILFAPTAWITLRFVVLLAWDLLSERKRQVRIPLEISHDGKQVRRFAFTAHDGTLVIVWHENEMLADYEFERSKWGGKPKLMKELLPGECVGR